jgi:hypothetical protein
MSDTMTKIMEALEELPEARRREVLEYVESLREEEERQAENGERDPEEDPLLKAIGSVDADLGSDRIDEILYGK